MRVLVLGAGGVGGYFGGRLAEAKHDVTFLVRPSRAATLAETGLAIESPLGNFNGPIQLTTADKVAGPYDLVLLTAKHYDLDAAISTIRPAVGPDTAVLPLLNGLRHLDQLKAAFGARSVLGGVAYVGATLRPDGSIRHHNRLSGITFGERDGGTSERVRAIAALYEGTPVTATVSENILLDMWEKFVMITSMAGMNCLMRGTVGDILTARDGETLMVETLRECQAVAEASGYGPRPQSRERVQAMLTERDSINNASMHHDLASGSRTEADAIIGDMLDRAGRLSAAMPLLRAAYCHLQVHENRLKKAGI